MANTKYTLRYLSLFEQELTAARDYIASVLMNPTAALRLVDETERAIQKRLSNPLAFEKYYSVKHRKHPYYCINVRNFMVFYVVIGDVMEVRHFVYSKRDLSKLL
jgi:plasmid stabilization system protein ParE